jgi:hypothetical protein
MPYGQKQNWTRQSSQRTIRASIWLDTRWLQCKLRGRHVSPYQTLSHNLQAALLGRGNLRGNCSSQLECPNLCGGSSAKGIGPKLHGHQESLLLRARRSATGL